MGYGGDRVGGLEGRWGMVVVCECVWDLGVGVRGVWGVSEEWGVVVRR